MVTWGETAFLVYKNISIKDPIVFLGGLFNKGSIEGGNISDDWMLILILNILLLGLSFKLQACDHIIKNRFISGSSTLGKLSPTTVLTTASCCYVSFPPSIMVHKELC